jgi:two-component system, NtrC family, sensor kinase
MDEHVLIEHDSFDTSMSPPSECAVLGSTAASSVGIALLPTPAERAPAQSAGPNRRILLIDDTPSIHDDFRKILCTPQPAVGLEEAEALLFAKPKREQLPHELDSVFQGQDGHARVQAALAEGRPYALAFVDVRMPPGWDGVETVEKLWEADPRLQVVICTAYSDHSWEELLDRVAVEDRLLILKKPFDVIEVSQLARTLTAKWALAREAENQRAELEAAVCKLRASESQLRCTSQELEAFAYSVAHDLQAPVSRISSYGQLLAGLIPAAGDKAAHYLERIRANAAIGGDLIRGLLCLTDIARAQIRSRPVDLTALAWEVLAELQGSCPTRSVDVRVQDGLLAWADPQLLRVALTNLVENAWKFTSRREAAEITLGGAQETGEQAVFFVRDNGCGFDMAHADRLFQNFHRLHEPDEYPGTGVGLVTVSRVLARHGGRIWAESAPDKGSTFYFSLPRHRADDAHQHQP